MAQGGELRVGVVGTGAIAQIVHLPLLKQIDSVRVEGLCDLDHSKARALAERLGIPRVFRKAEQLFACDEVDAVVVCSPSHRHEEHAIAALAAGKHVLVERPLALTGKGAMAVCRAADRADRVLVVAYNNRYRPEVRGLHSFIQAGELGDIFSVHGTWFNRKVRPKRPTWRHRKDLAGGGAFMDLGVQVLDLCLWLVDYPDVERVFSHMHPAEGFDVEDSASALMQLSGGSTLSVQVTWSMLGERDRHHVRVFGSAGTATTYPLKVYKEVEHGTLDVTPQITPGQENSYTASYREELRAFAAAALGRAERPPLPREQVSLMRAVNAVYASAEKAREVRL